jgi:hypothetical protein
VKERKIKPVPLTVYTTWNRIAKAVAKLGNIPGLVTLADDLPARLVPLVVGAGTQITGWIEVEIQDHTGKYGPCFYDGAGQATALVDWVPHLPEYDNREGVSVPENVLVFIGL